jgi:hypothetical protein
MGKKGKVKSEKEGTMVGPLAGRTVRRSVRIAAANANAAAAANAAERLAAVPASTNLNLKRRCRRDS